MPQQKDWRLSASSSNQYSGPSLISVAILVLGSISYAFAASHYGPKQAEIQMAGSFKTAPRPVANLAPRQQDKDLIAAKRASEEAEKLRRAWDSKSLLQSIKKYEEARLRWHRINNQREEAGALKSIGEVYFTLSRNQEALAYFNQALQLINAANDQRLKIEILNDLAEVQIDLGSWDTAFDNSRKALTLSAEIGFIEGQAHALNNMGLAHHLLSEFQKALDLFDQALELWRAVGNHRGEAQTLTNIGYSLGDKGDLQKSLYSFNEALIQWRKSKDPRGEARTLTAIALLNSSLGEMQKAIDSHTDAIRVFQTIGDRAGEAVALNGLAYAYDTLGNKQKALDLHSKALQRFRAVGMRSSEAITLGLIAEIYQSMGDKIRAIDYYNRKLTTVISLGDRRAEAHTLRGLGSVFHTLGEKAKALDLFNRALSLSQSSSDPRAQAHILNNIGYIYEKDGLRQKALERYKQALSLNRATEDRAAEIATLHNITRAARDIGDLAQAYSNGRTLVDTIEKLRTKTASQELRASYFASLHQHYELYIDVLMQMHKSSPEKGYDAVALEASEKARGRVLLDLLNEAHADIRQGVDPVLLKRERDLQQLLNVKGERQDRLLANEHTEEQASAIKSEITKLSAQYEEVLAQIRSTSPAYAALTQARTLSIAEIQGEILDKDTILLEYFLANERSYLWVVTPTSIDTFELPGRSEIERLASNLYAALTSLSQQEQLSASQKSALLEKAGAEFADISTRLSQIILAPLAEHLGEKRLVIVADGALQFVPFAALLDPVRSEHDKSGNQPLIIRHEIIRLPSISVLAVLRKEIEGRSLPAKTLAILADPVFEKDDPRLTGMANRKNGSSTRSARQNSYRVGELSIFNDELTSRSEPLRFQRLPFASREAKALAELVQGQDIKLAIGFDANLATALSPELQEYRIVHFATHGLIYGAHPQLYGLVLSLIDEEGNPQDGFLRLNEIYNMKLRADLVVLSACQTALGKEIKGEGLVGLTRGFMYAGAARIVASLWKVDDRASAEMMKYFYEAMFSQQPLRPAAALRVAQIKMWEQDRWRLPYFWAAFTLEGEWR